MRLRDMDIQNCGNIHRSSTGVGKRICCQCRSLDEATFRLYSWVGARGAPRLVTEGGPAEDASSPSQGNSPTSRDEQENEGNSNKVDDPDLDHQKVRPLSGSTIATTSTCQTTIAPPSQSGPKDPEPAAESGNAPLDDCGLKRTISALTFSDLTSQTRTAFPYSEATNVPPAYARPRSEVGLPPLAPGETDEFDTENSEEDKMEEASKSGSRSRDGPKERPKSAHGYPSKARTSMMDSRSSV